jgi:hypothetical protein
MIGQLHPLGIVHPVDRRYHLEIKGQSPAAYVAIKPFYSVNIKMMIRLGLNAVSPNGDLLLIFKIFLSPHKRDITRNSAVTDGIYPGSKLVSLGGSRIR